MLKEFLRFVKDNRSNNTLRTYSSSLGQFDEWMKSKKSSIEKANAEDVRDYLEYKGSLNMTSGTIFLMIMKSYAKYALEHMAIGMTTEEIRANMIEQQRLNQIKSFQYPQKLAMNKKPKHKVIGMSLEDLEKFFKTAERYDKVVAYLLLYFCLRKNELFEIGYKQKVFKVDYKKNKATFRLTKWKKFKTKTLDFDENTKKVLMEYQSTPPLNSLDSLNKRFEKYDKRMGYRIYPHLLRHVAISHFQKTLAPIYPNYDYLIKNIAGHTTGKDMTAHYTDPKVFDDEIREIMTINHFLKSVNIQW